MSLLSVQPTPSVSFGCSNNFSKMATIFSQLRKPLYMYVCSIIWSGLVQPLIGAYFIQGENQCFVRLVGIAT